MKKSVLYILFITLFIFSLSGCSFLRGGDSDAYLDDSVLDEEGFEDSDEFDIDEDEEGFEGFSSGNLDMDFEDEDGEELAEGDSADKEPGDLSELDDEDEWEEEEEEEEGEGEEKRKGFFARLFSGDKKHSDEALEDDFYVDEEEESFEVEETSQEVVFQEESEEEDIQTENTTEPSSPSSVTPSETESSDSTEVQVTEEESSPPVRKSLNKVLEFAYNKSGFLVNAVYIARPNETLQSISQTIYGQDKTADLLVINSHLQDRAVVVGDKIYYNSPNRPNDNKRIVFYYQDNGQAPLYYDLSEGENIRAVASQLLGHPNSWKEIWATNPEIESKAASEGSFRIAYWTTTASSPKVQEKQASQVQPVAAPQENLAQAEPPAESLNELSPPPLPNNPELDKQAPPDEAMVDLVKPKVPEESPQEKPEESSSSKAIGIVAQLLQGQNLKSIAIVGFIFFIIIFLLFRLILKKRQEREFDYTSV